MERRNMFFTINKWLLLLFLVTVIEYAIVFYFDDFLYLPKYISIAFALICLLSQFFIIATSRQKNVVHNTILTFETFLSVGIAFFVLLDNMQYKRLTAVISAVVIGFTLEFFAKKIANSNKKPEKPWTPPKMEIVH